MKNVCGVVFAALIASSMILVPFASAATCPDDEKKPAAKKDGAKPKREPGAMFKKMDKNGDGKVSKDEFVNSRKSDDAKKKAEGFFGKMDFSETLIPYTWDTSWIPKQVEAMVQTMNSASIPGSHPSCKNCAYASQWAQFK